MARLQVFTENVTLPFGVAVDIVIPQCPQEVAPVKYYTEDYKLPVMFLLHGGAGAGSDYLRFSRIERLAEEKQICVVCPSVQNSCYTNMYRGYRWFDFVSQELYNYIHAVFPVSRSRGKNYVAGLSMGGYGAFRLGLTCPEKFGYIAVMSSAVGITEEAANGECPLPNGGVDLFGPLNEIRGGPNDMFHAARELAQSGKQMPVIYDACGTEDFTYKSNVTYRNLLRELGYHVTWHERPGTHTWSYWDQELEYIFDWLP